MSTEYTPTLEEVQELRRALYDARRLVDSLQNQIHDMQVDLCLCAPRQPRTAPAPMAMKPGRKLITSVAVRNVRKAIAVNGIEFPSVQAAADHFGITRQAMSKRLRKESSS